MKTHLENWPIEMLAQNFGKIEFPEFQREPTVWNLDKKQRLIDSILRRFDISSIYFHKKKDGNYDCIDGRQRLNAILSYLGINDVDDDHNAFNLKIVNEIYSDGNAFEEIQDKRYSKLPRVWKELIDQYKLNIVIITDVKRDREGELNLLFLRLQIASVLNAGEKLHAMTGDMRDWIFHTISQHGFFKNINLPTRRYAKEQVASQIVLNVFGKKTDGDFKRSRFTDMQDFFKRYSKFESVERKYITEIEKNLNIIVKSCSNILQYIRNRAIAVSVYLFVSELIELNKKDEIAVFANFLMKFLKTLKWQISKGIDIDRYYQDLLKFQSYVSQAAGEKSAIVKRHDFLKVYFIYFKNNRKLIKGDDEYKKKTHRNPDTNRNKIRL